MTDINKPTKFGAKIAATLNGGDPTAAAGYAAQPQLINQAIAATEQQLQKETDNAIDLQNQFIKNFLWPALLDTPTNPAAMKATPVANPLEGPKQ